MAQACGESPVACRRRGPALQFDRGEAHIKGAVLVIVRQEPALEALVHHRGRDREVKRRRASFGDRLRVQFAFDGRRIFRMLSRAPPASRPRSHGFCGVGGR